MTSRFWLGCLGRWRRAYPFGNVELEFSETLSYAVQQAVGHTSIKLRREPGAGSVDL